MVIWTKPAKADLKHIHDFIAEDSKHYAKKVAQEIREKTDILSELPNAGKMVPEVGKPKIQELHIYSYRIMYLPLSITGGTFQRKIYLNPETKKPNMTLSVERYTKPIFPGYRTAAIPR